MRIHRVSLLCGFIALAALPAVAAAQEYKIEAIKEGPPANLAGPIKDVLGAQGYRVIDDQGKPYAELWLRKAIPASAKPGGPQGAVLYPFLAEGALLGVLRYLDEGHDYRNQAIAKGVYTLRYGLQPVNGDHLGVSTYRDYALVVPASKDQVTADLSKKRLEEQSMRRPGRTIRRFSC